MSEGRKELPPATSAFLEELVERARDWGWGDGVEITNFVERLYRDAGLPVPDLDPFFERETGQ